MTRPSHLVALLAASLSLTACVGGPASLGGEPPLTPTGRYQLQVEPGLDRIALAVHEQGLTANQGAALQGLIQRYAASGAQAMVIEAPEGADPVALQSAYAVQAALTDWGVPTNQIRLVSYAGPDARAPIVVGFQTVRAVVPRCGQVWGNLSRTGDNQASANFGCAVTANLAAQIENPRDIETPRAMTPTDAPRRTVVIAKYRAGEQTAAPQEVMVGRARIATVVE